MPIFRKITEKDFLFFVVEELTYEEVKLAMLRKSFRRVILQK
jgi:hypothetical protein